MPGWKAILTGRCVLERDGEVARREVEVVLAELVLDASLAAVVDFDQPCLGGAAHLTVRRVDVVIGDGDAGEDGVAGLDDLAVAAAQAVDRVLRVAVQHGGLHAVELLLARGERCGLTRAARTDGRAHFFRKLYRPFFFS